MKKRPQVNIRNTYLTLGLRFGVEVEWVWGRGLGLRLRWVWGRGLRFVDSEKKVIELNMNPKEPELMRKLNKGLCVLNEMDVHDMHGRAVCLKCELDGKV